MEMHYSQEYLLGQVKALESILELERSRLTSLRLELDSAQLRVQDSERELVEVKKKARLRESELEMALDLARVQALAKE
jgi:hypothetical protein